MHRPRWLALLVALTLVMAFAVPLVAVGQGDDDGRDDDHLERKVSVRSDNEGVEIELKREEASAEDKVEVSFDFEDAEFALKHETEEGENETENKLEVAFETLAEYEDGNGNGQYDVGERLVSSWSFGDEDDDDRRSADRGRSGGDDDDDGGDDGDDDAGASAHRAEWQGAVAEDIQQGGADGKKITATATLGDNGTFELRMYVFGDFVNLNGTTLEPTGVKFDIVIQDYPFAQNDTALVLFLETKAKREVEQADDDEHEDDEEAVAASGVGDLRLVFSWKTNATVDGRDTTVGSTLMGLKEETEDGETKQERELALSYARGASILHDPQLRVMTDSHEEASSPGAPLALLVIGIVAAVALGRRRGLA